MLGSRANSMEHRIRQHLLCTYFSPGFSPSLYGQPGDWLTKDHYILEYLLNPVLDNVHVWITFGGVTIASHKFEFML